MKTNLLNPVQYDEAIMELLRNNKPSESLQLAINLLRDARALAEKKLTKIIPKENTEITSKEFYAMGGFDNPNLLMVMAKGHGRNIYYKLN